MNTMSAYELTCIIAKAKAFDCIVKSLIASDTPEEGGRMAMDICLETHNALNELTKQVEGGE